MNEGEKLLGKEKYHAIKAVQKMQGYIDFYVYLLDKIEENYVQYIQTKKKKYLNQTDELREMLKDAAGKALNDV